MIGELDLSVREPIWSTWMGIVIPLVSLLASTIIIYFVYKKYSRG